MGKQTIISNLNLGGISDSEFQGSANSVFQTSCLDLHSEPGIIKVNQALKKVGNTGSLGIASIACSDGKIYSFHQDGKVYIVGSTLELATDIALPILDAVEFDGYIYYSTPANLGRVAVPASGYIDWGTKNNTYGEFTNDNPDYHPMIEINMILYIGDGNLVAQVDGSAGHAFTADALDLRKEYTITLLGQFSNDLVIGAKKKGSVMRCDIFTWNTYGVSFSTSDPVPEASINAFLATDNSLIVQAGYKGNFYEFNGSSLVRIKRMQGDWSYNKGAYVRKNASMSLYGLPLFGLSNKSGNPTKQGIYSYGAWSSGYPNIINHEYNISEGEDQDIEIGSILIIENDMIVSWKSGDIYGIDRIDWQKKAPRASFETRKMQMYRIEETISGWKIAWRKLPLGTSITLTSIENETIERPIELMDDAEKQISYTEKSAIECATLRMRVEMLSNENYAPEIEMLIPVIQQ